MDELIIHVGLPKTGTSALQKTIFDNRAALKNLGVYYPGQTVQARHQKLVVNFVSSNPSKKVFEDHLARYPRVIWSAEGLSNHFHEFSSESLLVFNQITSSFRKRVVFVKRNLNDFMWSYYKQCLLNRPEGMVGVYGLNIDFDSFQKLPSVQKFFKPDILAEKIANSLDADLCLLEYKGSIDEIFKVVTNSVVPNEVGARRINNSLPDKFVSDVLTINSTLSGARREQALDRLLYVQKINNLVERRV